MPRSSSALPGLPRGAAKLTHYRIDATHSNSYAAWQRMGSPIAPDEKAYENLRAAGQLATLGEPADLRVAVRSDATDIPAAAPGRLATGSTMLR